MTDPPAGFVLEEPGTDQRSASPTPPPGFVLEEPPDTAESQSTALGKMREIIVSAAHGASFNTLDEIAAFGRSAFDLATGAISADQFQDRYGQVLETARERIESIPASTRIPSEIAGGVGTMIAAAPIGGAVAATRAGQVASQLPGWAKAAGLGGLFGGLYGAGGSEGDFGARATGGAQGAGLGAVTGAALYPVAKGVQYGVEKLGAAVKSRVAPNVTARSKVAEALARDEMTPAKVRSRLGELGPQATIADAGGRNVRGLARTTASVPGAAQNRAEIMLTQRAEGEAGRITAALKKGLDPQDYYAAEDAFLGNLRTRAAPLYDQAYAKYQSITSRALNRLLKSKIGQRALRETAEIVENERASGSAAYLATVDEELTAAARAAADVGKMGGVGLPGVTRGLSLRTWDQIKRGFDSLLDNPAYRNEITGKLNIRGRSVDQMRRTLIKELDKATGGDKSVYARARATYSGDAEVLTALRDGRKALNMDPEVIARQMAGLSEAGREAYRSGVARAIKDTVDKTVDTGSAARRIFGTARKRAQIRAAFPDQKSYNLLRKMLVAEQQFAKTRQYVHGGSQTTPRAAESADALTRVAGAAGVLAGGKVGPMFGGHALLTAGIGRQIGKALLGGSLDAQNLAVAKILFNRNQAMNQYALDTLFDATVWQAMPEVAKRRLGQALLLGVTQQEGKAMAQSGQKP